MNKPVYEKKYFDDNNQTKKKSYQTLRFFDLDFFCGNENQAVDALVLSVKRLEKLLVVTPNVDQIVKFNKSTELQEIYKKAEYVFADGMPLVWFSRLVSKNNYLPERINGTNLMYSFCRSAAKAGISVAFIGGQEGSALEAAFRLKTDFPELIIKGTYCPPFGFESDVKENSKIINLIAKWEPDVLFIGLGNPKQEKWVFDNWDSLSFLLAFGIGSAIDLISGRIRRAPQWIQKSGFEWLWRLLQEPRRLWKRYLIDDIYFIKIAFSEFIKIKRMQ